MRRRRSVQEPARTEVARLAVGLEAGRAGVDEVQLVLGVVVVHEALVARRHHDRVDAERLDPERLADLAESRAGAHLVERPERVRHVPLLLGRSARTPDGRRGNRSRAGRLRDGPTSEGRAGMRDAVIVEAVRTPVGRRGGALSGTHPADLSAHVLRALQTRTGIDPALVDDVIWGCVSQVGEQTFDIARTAVLVGRLAGVGARHHRRPPVRLVAAGDPLRGGGRRRRALRRRRRRRRRVDVARADGLGDRRGRLADRRRVRRAVRRRRSPTRASAPR